MKKKILSTTQNSILLNHNFIPYLPFIEGISESNGQISLIDASYIYGLCKNLESIGFSVHPSSFEAFASITEDKREEFYATLEKTLKEYRGVTDRVNVIFPNFPSQVKYMSDDELWINRLIHGLFVDENGHRATIPYEKEVRLPFYEKNDLIQLKTPAKKEFEQIFTNALKSSSPFNERTKEELLWFINNYPGYEKLIPDNIPSRENAITLAGYMISYGKNYEDVSRFCKNTTDVLRLAAVLNGDSAALTNKPNFKNITTHEKKVLIKFIDAHGEAEEMKKYKSMWANLGKQLHIGSEKYEKFTNAQNVFNQLRNEKVYSSRADLEKAIADKNIMQASKILKKHFTAEYARRFDFLLRNCQSKDEVSIVLDDFTYSIQKSSSKQLLELMQFYKQKNDDTLSNLGFDNKKVFLPKGGTKFYVKENPSAMTPSEHICNKIISIISSELGHRYRQKAHLGNIYIDDSIKGLAAPIKMREVSDGFKSAIRGSKVPMDKDKNYTRFFIHWCNCQSSYDASKEERVDIDLSSTFFNDKLNPMSRINFRNIRNYEYNAYHSGDFRDAPVSEGGAYEFIDIDFARLKEMGIKYVSCEVHSFSSQPFNNLPECFVGYEEISDVNRGELIEPSAIKAKINLNGANNDGQYALPFIVDVDTKELVWCDIYSQTDFNFSTSERNTSRTIYNMVASLVPSLSMEEVINLSIKDRSNVLSIENTPSLFFNFIVKLYQTYFLFTILHNKKDTQ